MAEHYSFPLVGLSLILSVLASWVALDLSGRVRQQSTRGRRVAWLAMGSAAMGIGIWSMHYVGMLAYRTAVPVLYDWPTVLISMLAALAASALALCLVTQDSLGWLKTAVGGSVMGFAIASMHYIGMSAMRMPMAMTYSRPLVVLSLVAAVVISVAGLRITFGSKDSANGFSRKKALSALVMGLAIPTMHYIGMAAARGTEGPGNFAPADLKHALPITLLSGAGVIAVSLLVLVVALVLASIDRRVAGFVSDLDGSKQSYSQLKLHYERLQQAFRAGGCGIWECDPESGLFYVDPLLRELYQMAEDGLPIPRAVWRQAVHPDDLAGLDAQWKLCLAGSDTYENEYRLVRARGEVRRVRSVASIIRRPDGVASRVLGMTWDVTSDRQREQESHDQATRFRLTLEAIGDAVIATDEDSRIIFMNPAACKLTGWGASDAIGQALETVFVTRNGQDGTVRVHPVDRCIAHGGTGLSEQAVLQGRTGVQYNIRKHIALLGQGRSAVITFQDTTEELRLRDELRYAASHDSLTGLANRAALDKHLGHLWEGNRYSGQTHCICMLDLDRFKMINDSSGHIAGDALLKETAKLLRMELREGDFAARMGGDEFMLLLPETTVEEAKPILERLMERIGQFRFHWRGKAYDLTVSVGVVSFDCFSPDPEVLISQADAATFTAKRNGRNQTAVYVDEGSAADHLQEMQIASDLRRCIEENCFELHAQPIVPASSPGSVQYFEVLLRMRGKDGKLISPALFIPAAERFGMMGMVDRWVIQNTFKAYAESMAADAQYRLAINLSGESLSDPSLWSFVSEQFLAFRVNPACITFEVTETGIIANLDAAKTFMTRCRQAGSRIALDDFGTGLSSLSYLKQFPLDTIKIDGGFIRSLANNSLDQAIIRSIGDIARSVGADTVAECVEDLAAVSLLQGLAVDWIQGWATGKPQPLREALARTAPETAQEAVPVRAGNRPFVLRRSL